MAKSQRASTTKANNAKLKSKVYGPVETARMERLSAKLLELAAQPRPSQKVEQDASMKIDAVPAVAEDETVKATKKDDAMEVDKAPSGINSGKRRVEKKKSRSSKASIVFPKYKDGKKVGLSKRKR